MTTSTSTRIHLFCAQFNTFLTTVTSKLHCSSARHYLPLCWLFMATISSPKLSNRQGKMTPIVRGMNLQRDVHVTCDPVLIKCSRKTPRKNTLLSYAQLSKSRKGKKNSTVFVSKLGVDHGSSPSGEILSGGGSVHRLSWQLRKIKPPSSENFAFVVSLIFLFKPKRSYWNTDSRLLRLKAKHNSFFSPSVTLFDLFGVILF